MKITLVEDSIRCPNCRSVIITESGFIGSIILSSAINKIKKDGGIVKCSLCKTKYEVKGVKK